MIPKKAKKVRPREPQSLAIVAILWVGGLGVCLLGVVLVVGIFIKSQHYAEYMNENQPSFAPNTSTLAVFARSWNLVVSGLGFAAIGGVVVVVETMSGISELRWRRQRRDLAAVSADAAQGSE